MVIKREVAYGIIQGLSEFWNCEELQDFTVVVGRTKFGCHRFLLAACSGFFRALFRSGMQETKLKCVTLEEVSSETFQLILEAIYTGRGILTNDNVIDIWRAASQLQITFMVTECEMFVLKSLSLENYVQYFHYGRLLSSQIVTETVWTFILKHCNSFFKTSYFHELPFSDVLSLIKSQSLETSSEDDVLKAILKWVEYKPDKECQNETSSVQVAKENIHSMSSDIKRNEKNSDKTNEDISASSTTGTDLKDSPTDVGNLLSCGNSVSFEKAGMSENTPTESDTREQFLFDLISNTRTCLASNECLEVLLNQPLINDNKQAREVTTRALLYQLQIGKRNGQWPTGATHRNKSAHENVAIMFGNDSKLNGYSFSKNNWNEYKCTNVFTSEIILRMITVDKALFSLYVEDNNEQAGSSLSVYQLTGTTWSKLNISLVLKSAIFSVVAVNECIYIVQCNKFWKLNPSLLTLVSLQDLPNDQPISHVTCYDHKIIAFHSVSTEGGDDETAVVCFDLSNNTWTRLNNLEGSPNGMISFKDDNSTYLLQSNGDMLKLVKPQSDIVDIEFIVKLWRCDWPLHGAVTFMAELYIYGVKSETFKDDPQLLKSVAGLFKKINYLHSRETDATKSFFVPFIARRNMLV